MPSFWQFPTVSMGLAPIMGIYQARFNRYLEDRGLKPKDDHKVWVYMGANQPVAEEISHGNDAQKG